MWWESDGVKHFQWKTWQLKFMSLMFKFSWEVLFFERGDTEAFKAAWNKLFASNEKQIDNYTLILDMLHSYMSVVCTYHCRGVLNFFLRRGCCSLLIFVTKTVTKGSELQYLCAQGTLQSRRVEDDRMMFIRHLIALTPIIYLSNTLHI